MRILIATGSYAPQIGGPATYVSILENELPAHGMPVVVVPFRDVRRYPVIMRHVLYGHRLYRAAKDADMIFALDPVSVGLPAVCVAWLLKKRFLVRIAGDYAWEQGVQRFKVRDTLEAFAKKHDEYLFPVLILKWIQKRVALYAESVIVPSDYMRRIVTAWGVPARNIITIYSVAEDIPFQGRKADFRKMLKFDGKMVVSAGRLVPWKGFDTLISLVPQLLKRYPEFKLLIAGDGPEMKRLEALVDRKKLHEHVALTGSLERDVLFKYIRMADVFVLNTGYEGFSHQLLEVMSIGVPIVTTKIGGNPELIEHNKNGLLVPYNNKKALFENIVSVLDSEHLSRKLVRNAKESIARFTTDVMIERLLIVLKKQ